MNCDVLRRGIEMPTIISRLILILSDAGLGMAMFSFGVWISDTPLLNTSIAASCIPASTYLSLFSGLFMALQPRINAYGNKLAAFVMSIQFLKGSAVMAAASIAVGLGKVLLRIAIVQV